jgi:hypothetical protein
MGEQLSEADTGRDEVKGLARHQTVWGFASHGEEPELCIKKSLEFIKQDSGMTSHIFWEDHSGHVWKIRGSKYKRWGAS